MKLLSFLCATATLAGIGALPGLAAASGDPAPQAAAAPAQKTPEELLFASVHVIGGDLTGGVGLDKEIGVPVTFADVIDASLLFPHGALTWHTFPSSSLAGEQVELARRAGATLVVAPDYLVPFVYADAVDDDARLRGIDTALKLLETLTCPLVLGDVPDFRATLTARKPAYPANHVPSVELLARVNAAVKKWAEPRKSVVLAPIADLYAHVASGEPLRARATNVPAAWLPELLQENRVHARAFGSILAWVMAFENLHRARPDLDGGRVDGSMISIFNRLYASKEAQRRALIEQALAAKRLPPNRPPPVPPPPPDPARQRREEDAKRRGVDPNELERQEAEARRKKKDGEGGG